MIVSMTREHIPEVIQIHCQVIPDELLPRLGEQFMARYAYERVLTSEYAVGFVYMHEGKVVGYIVGTIDSEKFHHYTLVDRLAILPILFRQCLRLPHTAFNLIEALVYFAKKKKLNIRSEIFSVCVLPEYRSVKFFRKHKINISYDLHATLIKKLLARGIESLVSVVSPKNIANIITLKNWGFKFEKEIVIFGGRKQIYRCFLLNPMIQKKLGLSAT